MKHIISIATLAVVLLIPINKIQAIHYNNKFTNNSQTDVKVTLHYSGESSVGCQPMSAKIKAGQKNKNLRNMACCLKRVVVEAATDLKGNYSEVMNATFSGCKDRTFDISGGATKVPYPQKGGKMGWKTMYLDWNLEVK